MEAATIEGEFASIIMNSFFRKFAQRISIAVGSPFAFIVALIIILIWAVSGPLFNFSDTWQLVINTGTTIITFLMVFLIQNTQNRDSRAMHIKLDELLKSSNKARNKMVNIEEIADEELEELQDEFRQLHQKYERAMLERKTRVKVTNTK